MHGISLHIKRIRTYKCKIITKRELKRYRERVRGRERERDREIERERERERCLT